jgi:hypothetical protein
MTVVAIHQPNYAPWCGFFAKLAHCDTFIFLDDVQMPRGRSWVHRTKIMEQATSRWLSVPCHRSAESLIKDVPLAEDRWAQRHLNTLRTNYGAAPFFGEVMELLAGIYAAPGRLLADFNVELIQAIAAQLGLRARCRRSSSLPSRGSGEERIVSLVQAVGGDTYLSGPGARAYQAPATFARAGIDLQVREYLPRSYGLTATDAPPEPVSVLDALFNCGREARRLLSYPDDPRDH